MGAPKRRWGLFDDAGAEALRSYKYVGQDLSLTYKCVSGVELGCFALGCLRPWTAGRMDGWTNRFYL